jgi:hypothetical protein
MLFSGDPGTSVDSPIVQERSLLKHFMIDEEEFKDAISDERHL